MRKYKYRVARLFHIVIWCIIIILSFNVLIKGIRILGKDPVRESSKSLESKVVSAACNHLIQSNIPILDYVSNKEEDINNNIILNTIIGAFPINQYIAQAKNSIDNNFNFIEEQRKGILFSYGTDLLFNNDLYVDMILKGIENSKSDNGLADNTDDLEIFGFNRNTTEVTSVNAIKGLMPIDIISGEVYLESEDASHPHDATIEALGSINGEYFTLEQLLNRQFLYNNFYIVDSATAVNDEIFDAEVLLGKNMTIKATSDKPQILIYHTHSQEAFSDSREGVEDDTVVGLGTYLEELLVEDYGYNVIHDKTKYDIMGGTLDRNLAYNYACEGVEKILEKYPTIEVVIDIHRDGANKRVSKVNGKSTAQIMLFNGLSRNSKGEIAYLNNPNLEDNLAFSLQLQLKGREMYPGLMYRNYLHAYRYNMHLRKKSLLVEVGTNKNTVKEAKNAMELFAVILKEVLAGES